MELRDRRRSVWWGWALALLCAATLTLPAAPAHAQAGSDRLLQLINADRAQHAARPLALSAAVSSLAQSHAQAMATARRISENPAFPGNVPAANAAGENVGYGPDVDDVHAAFVSSPEHQVNIVNPDYALVGIGLANSSIGLMVVEEFVDTAGGVVAPAPQPAPAPVAAPRGAPAPAPAKPPPPAPPVAAPPPPPPPPPVAAPPPPPPPPPPSFDVALYARMLDWAQWQVSDGTTGH